MRGKAYGETRRMGHACGFRYLIDYATVLSSGPSFKVYKATDTQIDKTVIIKISAKTALDDQPVNTTLQEINVLLTLSRHNVVKMIDLYEDADCVYSVFDYGIRYAIDYNTLLGSGSSAKVYRAIDTETGTTVAIKISRKNSESSRMVMRELNVLLTLSHPNIIKMFEAYEDAGYFYSVFEYVPYGELFSHIEKETALCDIQSRRIVQQIASALAYIHKNSIIHCDIKPENVLISSRCPHIIPMVRLIDFGLCQNSGSKKKRMCGSPEYVSPEVLLLSGYDEKVDCWSLGVLAYATRTGMMPFSDTKMSRLVDSIIRGRYRFPDMDDLTEDFKSFVKTILVTDPQKRPSASQILKLKWLEISQDEEPAIPRIIKTRSRSGSL